MKIVTNKDIDLWGVVVWYGTVDNNGAVITSSRLRTTLWVHEKVKNYWFKPDEYAWGAKATFKTKHEAFKTLGINSNNEQE